MAGFIFGEMIILYMSFCNLNYMFYYHHYCKLLILYNVKLTIYDRKFGYFFLSHMPIKL